MSEYVSYTGNPITDKQVQQIMDEIQTYEQQDLVSLMEDILLGLANGDNVSEVHQLVFNYNLVMKE